jgi:RNA polymerase sigma factor (TIGR02999 family)
MSTPQETMDMLDALQRGEEGAADRLLPVVYDELHELASHLFRREPAGHTLQPTALVHEAYLRLVGRDAAYESRAHFVAVAAKAMRHLLVDRARRQRSAKHGGGAARVALEESLVPDAAPEVDLLALDDAVRALAALDERKARVVELRFFGGLGIDETAAALGVARSTIAEDWRMARAWLARELADEAAP